MTNVVRYATLSLTVALCASPNLAAYPIQPTANGNWSFATGSDAGFASNWYPTSVGDFAAVAAQGFATYNERGWSPPRFMGYTDTSAGFHVFTTYAVSATSQTLFFLCGGDDGHSIFVDDNFIAGGGFGTNVTGAISFVANQPLKLTLANYNAGPGEWHIGLGFRAISSGSYRPIEDMPSVSTSATPVLLPEPSTCAMALAGLACGGYSLFRRRRTR